MNAAIIETDARAIVLDLSRGAKLGGQPIAGLDVASLTASIEVEMRAANTAFAFGRYLEPRELYVSEHFTGGEGARTIHLGIDLFCRAGTRICAPLDGQVAHVANNDRELDYGPMLILEHRGDDGRAFFTLYGHLGTDLFERLSAGQRVTVGEHIATVGAPPGNGNWPPHLHFQLIRDLAGLGTEFPGVAARHDLDHWRALSPSPAAYFPEMPAAELEYPEGDI